MHFRRLFAIALSIIASVINAAKNLRERPISIPTPPVTKKFTHSAVYPNVGITSFTKDEIETLPYWLRYHAALVGIQNIIVLDNFSTNPEVINLLKNWEQDGLKVLWEQGPLTEKGRLQAEAFKHFFPVTNLDPIPSENGTSTGSERNSNINIVANNISNATTNGNTNYNYSSNNINNPSNSNYSSNSSASAYEDPNNNHRIFLPLDSDEFVVPVHNHRPVLSACAFNHVINTLNHQYSNPETNDENSHHRNNNDSDNDGTSNMNNTDINNSQGSTPVNQQRVTCWQMDHMFTSLVHERNQSMATLDTFQYIPFPVTKVLVHAQGLIAVDIGHHTAELRQGVCQPFHPPPPITTTTSFSTSSDLNSTSTDISTANTNNDTIPVNTNVPMMNTNDNSVALPPPHSSLSLSLLHYHTRSPTVTLTRALYQSIAYGYLPPNTTLHTLPTYKQHLISLTNFSYTTDETLNNTTPISLSNLQGLEIHVDCDLPGQHKLIELLQYLEFGEGFFYSPRPSLRVHSKYVVDNNMKSNKNNKNNKNNKANKDKKKNDAKRKKNKSSNKNSSPVGFSMNNNNVNSATTTTTTTSDYTTTILEYTNTNMNISDNTTVYQEFEFYNIEDIIRAIQQSQKTCHHYHKKHNHHKNHNDEISNTY